jgi:hypothetical protein
VRRGTQTNPARLSQRFEPGGNVDAVTKDVAILDDDVAQIDSHAKFDAALCRYCGVAYDHLALHLDRTAHRVDDAGKLDKQAIAGGCDDAAAMLTDLRIEELTAERLEAFERTLLVGTHQPRISRHIDGQDRGEAAAGGHALIALRRRG